MLPTGPGRSTQTGQTHRSAAIARTGPSGRRAAGNLRAHSHPARRRPAGGHVYCRRRAGRYVPDRPARGARADPLRAVVAGEALQRSAGPAAAGAAGVRAQPGTNCGCSPGSGDAARVGRRSRALWRQRLFAAQPAGHPRATTIPKSALGEIIDGLAQRPTMRSEAPREARW